MAGEYSNNIKPVVAICRSNYGKQSFHYRLLYKVEPRIRTYPSNVVHLGVWITTGAYKVSWFNII